MKKREKGEVASKRARKTQLIDWGQKVKKAGERRSTLKGSAVDSKNTRCVEGNGPS